jgi:hypothetical protein
MNDIYKQKAEKYKYKYLKLKQELYGGEHQYPCSYDLPKVFDDNLLDFGTNISGKLKILTDYPINTPNIDFNRFNIVNNTGIILKHEDYLILLPILTHQNAVEYTTVKYACTINKEKRKKKYGLFKSGTNYIRTIFPNCDHILKMSATKNEGKFGYIITENIKRINVDNLITKIDLFIQFINDLINTLNVLIEPLHNAGYILNNIENSTIRWDKTKKQVHFNITKITKDTNKYKDINYLIYFINELSFLQKYRYTRELLKKFDDKNMSINKLINNLPKINECIKYEKELFKCKDKIREYENLSLDDYLNIKAISDEVKTLITKEIPRLTEISKEQILKIDKLLN